jgi:hypothetical protein
MKISKNMQLGGLGIIVIFAIVAAFFLGDQHGVENMTFRQVTPNQIAEAMKNDHFYSSYRENTLMITGTVLSVTKNNNDLLVGFKTDSAYGAFCDFGNAPLATRAGNVITAFAESGAARRQPSAVLLKNCIVP